MILYHYDNLQHLKNLLTMGQLPFADKTPLQLLDEALRELYNRPGIVGTRERHTLACIERAIELLQSSPMDTARGDAHVNAVTTIIQEGHVDKKTAHEIAQRVDQFYTCLIIDSIRSRDNGPSETEINLWRLRRAALTPDLHAHTNV